MHVLIMKMFDMEWYNHPMLHVALHGTLMHFYPGELLFSHTLCAVDLILKRKSVTLQSRWHMKCMCARAHTHTHTHNLMVTFTNAYHVLSNVYTLGTFLHLFALIPLANLHHFLNCALIFGLTSFGWLCSIMPNPYF